MLVSPPNQDSGTATMQRAPYEIRGPLRCLFGISIRLCLRDVKTPINQNHPSPGKAEGRTHSGKGEG